MEERESKEIIQSQKYTRRSEIDDSKRRYSYCLSSKADQNDSDIVIEYNKGYNPNGIMFFINWKTVNSFLIDKFLCVLPDGSYIYLVHVNHLNEKRAEKLIELLWLYYSRPEKNTNGNDIFFYGGSYEPKDPCKWENAETIKYFLERLKTIWDKYVWITITMYTFSFQDISHIISAQVPHSVVIRKWNIDASSEGLRIKYPDLSHDIFFLYCEFSCGDKSYDKSFEHFISWIDFDKNIKLAALSTMYIRHVEKSKKSISWIDASFWHKQKTKVFKYFWNWLLLIYNNLSDKISKGKFKEKHDDIKHILCSHFKNKFDNKEESSHILSTIINIITSDSFQKLCESNCIMPQICQAESISNILSTDKHDSSEWGQSQTYIDVRSFWRLLFSMSLSQTEAQLIFEDSYFVIDCRKELYNYIPFGSVSVQSLCLK